MKLHEHILPDYDVRLVGTEAEVIRYRRDVAKMREALQRLYDGRRDLPNWAAGTVEDLRT